MSFLCLIPNLNLKRTREFLYHPMCWTNLKWTSNKGPTLGYTGRTANRPGFVMKAASFEFAELLEGQPGKRGV